jgi:hypothetical protein
LGLDKVSVNPKWFARQVNVPELTRGLRCR